MSAPSSPVQGVYPTWKYIWQLIRFRPWLYLGFMFLEILFFAVFPQIAGLIIQAIFNQLTGDAQLSVGLYGLIALFVAVALGKAVASFADVAAFFSLMYTIGALLRRNMFIWIMGLPGGKALPASPGEAISRFREDVNEIAFFMADLLVAFAFGLFAVVALIVMARTNSRITLFVVLPLLAVIVAANLATRAIQKYRQASREATGKVTGFIGELFGAVLATKVAAAEPHMLAYLDELNEHRRQTTVKDKLFNSLMDSLYRNTVNLGTGLILLAAGSSMRSGAFTVGDLALFVYYLGFVTDFSAVVGNKIAAYRQAGVSFARMERLMQGASSGSLVESNPIYMTGDLPAIHAPQHSPSDRLEQLRNRRI